MGDVVCVQIKREVDKQGNDKRNEKTNKWQEEVKVLGVSLGWTSGGRGWGWWGSRTLCGYRYKGSLGQGCGLLERSSFLPSPGPEGNGY